MKLIYFRDSNIKKENIRIPGIMTGESLVLATEAVTAIAMAEVKEASSEVQWEVTMELEMAIMMALESEPGSVEQ